MIVCSCRNISTNDFDTTDKLNERLLHNDINCSKCIKEIKMKLEGYAIKRTIVEADGVSTVTWALNKHYTKVDDIHAAKIFTKRKLVDKRLAHDRAWFLDPDFPDITIELIEFDITLKESVNINEIINEVDYSDIAYDGC
jgi:hypothetical protein